VDLTGLDSTSFDNALDTIKYLSSQIDRYLPSNKLDTFKTDTYDQFKCITISTRYFSPRNNSESTSIVPFTPAVDPHKLLSSFCPNNLIHTIDNEVLFYNSIASTDSMKPRYVTNYTSINALIFNNSNIQILPHRTFSVSRRRYRRGTNNNNRSSRQREQSQAHLSTTFYSAIGQFVYSSECFIIITIYL
jgi:hypothetical protein